MTAVTLTQIIRFCASGVLDTPTVDPATDEHQIARLREADGADLPDEYDEDAAVCECGHISRDHHEKAFGYICCICDCEGFHGVPA